MDTLEVTRRLPATLLWSIAFDLHTVRGLVDDDTVRRMFILPPDTVLDGSSHVVLTRLGPHLAPDEPGPPRGVWTGAALPTPADGASMVDRIGDRLDLIRLDAGSLTCLGVADQIPLVAGLAPVLLGVAVDPATGWGDAEALFAAAPRTQPADLLRSVGVQYLGGEDVPGGYRAQLRIHLPTHVQAGRLSGFTRGDNCTRLFIAGGELTPDVERGLALAGRDRVADGHARALRATADAVRSALSDPAAAAMRCEPPPPAADYAYGDVVPLGLPLRALRGNADPELAATATELRTALIADRREGLWSFHRGGLPTATDSALVIPGLDGPERADALRAAEIFRTDEGGYLPQLSAPDRDARQMAEHPAVAHWCQPDFPTTALLAGLRREAGLPPDSEDYLRDGVDRREGLFFANPYLADWALAQGLAGNPGSRAARRLLAQVLGSMNRDHTFGRYDVAFSTALGILTLAALDYRGRTLRIGQLRLLELLDADGGAPPATPFYQSLRCDGEIAPRDLFARMLSDDRRRIVTVGGATYEVSLFVDRARLITSAVAALALDMPCRSSARDDPRPSLVGQQPARYEATDPADYAGRFALPQYVRQPTGARRRRAVTMA